MEKNALSTRAALVLAVLLATTPLAGCGTAMVATGAVVGTTYMVGKAAVKTTVGAVKLAGKGVSRLRGRDSERDMIATGSIAQRSADAAAENHWQSTPQSVPLAASPVSSGLY